MRRRVIFTPIATIWWLALLILLDIRQGYAFLVNADVKRFQVEVGWISSPGSTVTQPPMTIVLFQTNKEAGDKDNNKDDDDEEEATKGIDLQRDYEKKVAEAQAALAAVEEARQNMQKSTPSLGLQPSSTQAPPTLRSTITETDAGTLVIDIPSRGMSSNVLFNGAFSLAWFSAIVPATFSGAGLFMVPFWLAGGLVAKQAFVDPFLSSTITIGQYGYTVQSKYAGQLPPTQQKQQPQQGSTEGIAGARVEIVAYVNGVPQCELQLYGKTTTTIPIGANLEVEELEYLADRINQHLNKVQSMPDLLPPLP